MAEVVVAASAVPAQAGTVEAGREVAELTALLAGAISGQGYRGPSTDARVLARRLVESERVRVDGPGRLSVDQVATLALRCGQAETALREERLRRAVVEADAARLAAELAGEQGRTFELEALLRRACTNGGGRYLAEVGLLGGRRG